MFGTEELKTIFNVIYGDLESTIIGDLGRTSVEIHELAPEFFEDNEETVKLKQSILKKIVDYLWTNL